MIMIFLLIPLSIVTAAVFLAGFIWAVRSGQYEDTCTPTMRLLAEEASAKNPDSAKPVPPGDEPVGIPTGKQDLS
jgi:cbb3-type cytochrome oxidase maturation protein